ncbi:MAG: helix-turn-helix domain-containing protein [Acidimicrobiia bacterium]|nr:helix-turn-helix domain-containing protein [Acidimicrobiia bacterium]
MSTVDRLAYSPAEAAQALGCTRQHIYNMLTRGELHSIKLGKRRFIPRAGLEALLAEDQGVAS